MLIRIAGFAYQYASSAIIAEVVPSSDIDSVALDGRPGTRAPHVWVEYQGKRVSTLDLFGRDFVLLTGSHGADWCEAAHTVVARSGLNLVAYRVGPDGDLSDPESKWQAKAGVQADGALLVRPDGFVAWRSQTGVSQPEQVLEQVLNQALGQVSSVS